MNNNENSRFAGSQSETENKTQTHNTTEAPVHSRLTNHARRDSCDSGSENCRDPRATINPPSSLGHPVSTCAQSGPHANSDSPSTVSHAQTGSVELSTAGRFHLRKDYGFWRLTHAGQEAILKHETGLEYVAWLMAHPNEAIHALDLAVRVSVLNGKLKPSGGILEIENPRTGEKVPVEIGSRIQERSLFLEDARAVRAALRRQAELERYVEDVWTTDPEREEAYEELKKLYALEDRKSKRVRDAAGRASDAVGRAITRLVKRLRKTSAQNPVLMAFVEHVKWHILVPSGRGAHGGVRPEGTGGFFVYEEGPDNH